MRNILILIITIVTASIYASGFALPEQGAKAISMGNAFAAVADDASALFYNPAGITNLEGKINFNLGATLLIPKSTWEYEDDSAETTDGYPVAPQFNFVFKVMPKLSVGLGVSAPYAAKIEWPDAWAGAGLVEMMSLQTVDVSPTIAYQVIKGLSFALTYDLGIAAVELRKRVKLSSDDYMLVEMATSEKALGHGFKVSLMYQFNALKTGFVFKYGKKFDFKGNANFSVSNPIFNPDKPSNQTMELTLNLPMEFIWGISYEIIPNKLLVAFDTQYTMWSSYDELKFKFEKEEFDEDEDGNKTRYSTTPKNWNDVLTIKFGMEYKVMPNLALRAGYVYDFNPIPDETLDPSLPDNDRHVMSTGIGYNLKNMVQFDLAYSYVIFTERTSVNDELLGTYNTHVNIISFTTGFKF